MSPRAHPKTLGGAMPSMSDLKSPSGLWSEPGSRFQFWADLQPGMLLEIKPAQFGMLAVYGVDAWGNVHADGAQTIVAPKVVLVVRVNVMDFHRLYIDLILGDSIWRLFDQEGLSMTMVS